MEVIAMGSNPDYIVRVEGIEKGDKFYDIGVAYKNSRGSVTVYLKALPLNNKVMLIPTENGE